MATPQFTCPRCLYCEPLRPDMRFCPRCGLEDAKDAWQDHAPVDIAIGGRSFKVMDRIAVGSVCSIYRCQFKSGAKEVEGVFKVARDSCANQWVHKEAAALRRLHSLDSKGRFAPFLPKVEASVAMGDPSAGMPRAANVLRMDEHIKSPDELYTLIDIAAAYPSGLSPRHVAWMWRRLLNILGFAHAGDVVHGAVLPMHILIEPREHKLILIDWCCATEQASRASEPVTILTGGYTSWFKREGALRSGPTPGLDVGLGARCMIELMGGDPVKPTFPDTVEAGLQRYFTRCIGDGAMRGDAWRLLDDFDRLIEATWGRREFKVLEMPPKRGS